MKYKWPPKDNNFTATVRFIRWNTCRRFKVCATCAKLKANQNRAKFIKFLDQNPPLINKNRYYLVLPIKHTSTDKLEDLFKKLDTSVEKIRQSIKDAKRWKNQSSIFRFIEWAVLSIEFTYNNNGWNPHLNLLFCTDHTYDLSKKWQTMFNQEISDARLQKTGDSYIVSIQKVDVKEKIYEVLKYITKFSTLPDDKRLELFLKTPRYRFMRKRGILYWAPIDEKTLADEERKKLEIIFPMVWNTSTQRYDLDRDNLYRLNKTASEEDGTSERLEIIANSFKNKENWLS